jgi:hypothetical protein
MEAPGEMERQFILERQRIGSSGPAKLPAGPAARHLDGDACVAIFPIVGATIDAAAGQPAPNQREPVHWGEGS